MSPSTLPIFDLGGATDAQQAIALCQRHGFLYVRGHGIPDALMSALFEVSRRFFALERAEKERIHYRLSGGNGGYVPPLAEATDRTTKGDEKEAFAMGLRLPDIDPALAIAPKVANPNQWPDGVPDFRRTVEQTLAAMRGVAGRILGVIAEGLGGRPDFFADKLGRPLATLRLNRYPAQDPGDDGAFGIGRHTDMECMSLLAQDDVGGLEVVSPDGRWREAVPVPGTLVLIVGEQLTRWTNGILAATPHRVVNRAGRERYSTVFFFTTDVDAPIGVIDGLLRPGEVPRFEPVLAGDHVARRLHEVYA